MQKISTMRMNGKNIFEGQLIIGLDLGDRSSAELPSPDEVIDVFPKHGIRDGKKNQQKYAHGSPLSTDARLSYCWLRPRN